MVLVLVLILVLDLPKTWKEAMILPIPVPTPYSSMLTLRPHHFVERGPGRQVPHMSCPTFRLGVRGEASISAMIPAVGGWSVDALDNGHNGNNPEGRRARMSEYDQWPKNTH